MMHKDIDNLSVWFSQNLLNSPMTISRDNLGQGKNTTYIGI